MKYTISYTNPNSHYIDLKVEVETKGEHKLNFQLPSWRPGRYELSNFAKNIQHWKAFDENGKLLPSKKLSKDLWEVECNSAKKVVVAYNYFAFELNAGSTYLDESQLYVNPVNCFLYLPNRMEESCELELELSADYKLAIPLESIGKNKFHAANFDEMADSPFVASASLQHCSFKCEGTTFHLWFQGEFKMDERKLIKDFEAFTKEQIALFGDFPTKEYHYTFQILTHSFYHRVEHAASTVIALGPSYDVLEKEGRYEDLLGVSSHELFHTWNVKRIRPIEMWPYDFTKENYSRLGYLAEGATTWYGDLMLYRSDVFDDAAYFRTFNQLLDRHFNNPGVENLSVAESSFDTWLDGYSMGIPNRKSSIYTEGALITFMLDSIIRKNSNNQKSFDDVMRVFYEDYYKANRGISEADYKNEVEKMAGTDLTSFFDEFINGAKNITEVLAQSMNYIGLEYKKNPADEFYEAYLGFKILENKVVSVFPNSVAETHGISIMDEVISINSIKINDDLSKWCRYFKDDVIELQIFDQKGQLKTVVMKASTDIYYGKYEVNKIENPSETQKEAFKAWKKSD